ncbi:MAG TPA: rhodanese-like domain-containing protein [Galbitalea sp.]|jgi:thiosulfate/3-mercaptopyruvate sulfurtransferase|nr:rhodanese-like domain-containing protein [Galbitalea sp.]
MTGPALTAPLVSTQWLADYLGNEQLIVLDATVLPFAAPGGRPGFLSGHEQYIVHGHIPGAVFADLIEEFSDTESKLPFTHQDPDAFAAAAGALGIDNETTVVVYDGAIGQWASRLWWLFRANGYDRVAVLDGGYTKWLAEERATDVGHVEPGMAQFTATTRPELWATSSDIEAIIAGTENGALVCGLPPREFSGEEGSRARRGHIPGSINVPAGRLVSRETNTVIPEAELRAEFGTTLNDDRIVAYCAAGIAASADALALTLLGHRNVAIYDGSLFEWSADERFPVASLV